MPGQSLRQLFFKGLSENSEGRCFRAKNWMAVRSRTGTRDEGESPSWASTEKQRSQSARCSKTLREADHLSVARAGFPTSWSCGQNHFSPRCPHPKSLAAAPLAIFRQALNREPSGVPKSTGDRVRTVARRLQPLPIGAIHHTPCLIIKTSAVLMMFFGSVLPGHGQSAPTIGTQPLSQTNLAGTAVTFSVVVAGRGPRADSSERAGSWR